MQNSPHFRKHHKRGFILLSTLLSLLILSSLVIAVQQKSAANIKVIARLTAELQNQADIDSIYERLRGLLADAMTGTTEGRPLLNSTHYLMSEGGKEWVVQVQDVEGLVDIYLSPPDILALLPIDARAFAAGRDRALAELIVGERFPTLAASLARFGAKMDEVRGMVTQSSQTGRLRMNTLPETLQRKASGQPPGGGEGEQVVKVAVSIKLKEP